MRPQLLNVSGRVVGAYSAHKVRAAGDEQGFVFLGQDFLLYHSGEMGITAKHGAPPFLFELRIRRDGPVQRRVTQQNPQSLFRWKLLVDVANRGEELFINRGIKSDQLSGVPPDFLNV